MGRRRLRVAWGLRRIELHERIGERTGRRLTRFARRWATARAARRVPPLRRWEGIPERTFARFARGRTAVRLVRVLELIPAGRRIVDIGIGQGYVAGVLLRDRRPSHYCGVELRQELVDATRAMIDANGLGDRPVELVVRDVLDLDEGFWRDHDPDVVLLLEVLEHLGDPAGALRAIAAAVRPGTAIVFSVPLHGRLERVWGHRSVFDRRRLERLCRQAGLAIERAEPVQGTWSLIVGRTGGAPAGTPSDEPDPGYTFSRVPVGRQPGRPERRITLEVPSPRAVKVDLGINPPGAARRLRVRGLDDSGEVRLEWSGPAAPSGRDVYVLRPGRRAGSLAPTRRGDAAAVASIEISAEPQPGAEVGVTVHRAAYIPHPPVG